MLIQILELVELVDQEVAVLGQLFKMVALMEPSILEEAGEVIMAMVVQV
tara:strand:+ start:802 stop:948 length:147 start_codon:yes stop_codon:yes gene_type:complete